MTLAEDFQSRCDAAGVIVGMNDEYAAGDGGIPWGMSSLSIDLGVPLPVILLSHAAGDSTDAYLVAMHELGHLILLRDDDEPPAWDPSAQDGFTDADTEAQAWQWALDHSAAVLEPADYARVLDRLMSYESPQWDALVSSLRARVL